MSQPQQGQQQVPPSANDALMSGGAKAAAFPVIGSTVRGTVLDVGKVIQSVDDKTKQPEFFPSGDPMWIILVPIQTDLRDPAIPDDRGERTLWIRGAMQKAVREAVKAAGCTGLEPGGIITVQYTADGPKGNNIQAPKIYAAHYVAPPAQAQNALMGVTPGEQFQADGSIGQVPQGNGGQVATGPVQPQTQQVQATAPATGPAPGATIGSLQNWQPPNGGQLASAPAQPTVQMPPPPPGWDPAQWTAAWAAADAGQRQQFLAAAQQQMAAAPPF